MDSSDSFSIIDKSEDNDQFGNFEFSRAFHLGMKAFQRNMGNAVALNLAMLLLIVLAIASCLGFFAAVPHLYAGYSLFGLYMARNNLNFSNLMSGFQSYGTVLIAVILMFLLGIIVSLISYIPYIIKFSSIVNEIGIQGNENYFDVFVKVTNDPAYASILSLYSSFTYVSGILNLYFGARFILLYPLVIERKYGAIEAIKTSWRITENSQWYLLLLIITTSILSFTGFIFCFVGLIFSIPLAMAIHGSAIYMLLGEDKENR